MFGMSMSMKVCSPKRTARMGAPTDRSGLPVLRARGSLMGGITPEGLDMPYRSPSIKYRSPPRNAPSRSKIEARKDWPDHTPTAPGGHAKGDNCATELPVTPGSTGGSPEANWEIKYGAQLKPVTNGYGSRRTPAGPEGGKRGVRVMEKGRLVQLSTKPTACREPPWQALLDKIDAAKILRVLGKRKAK